MEQKHTPCPEEWLNDRYFGVVPTDTWTLPQVITELERYGSDLLQQVSALTKENELLTKENWEMKRWSVHEENKALTSQVEKLKAENLLLLLRDQDIDRLREEKKELVEALREVMLGSTVYRSFGKTTENKIKSLLSKFEVPNQS